MNFDAEILNEMVANKFTNVLEKLYTMTNGIYSRYARPAYYWEISLCNPPYQQVK